MPTQKRPMGRKKTAYTGKRKSNVKKAPQMDMWIDQPSMPSMPGSGRKSAGAVKPAKTKRPMGRPKHKKIR